MGTEVTVNSGKDTKPNPDILQGTPPIFQVLALQSSSLTFKVILPAWVHCTLLIGLFLFDSLYPFYLMLHKTLQFLLSNFSALPLFVLVPWHFLYLSLHVRVPLEPLGMSKTDYGSPNSASCRLPLPQYEVWKAVASPFICDRGSKRQPGLPLFKSWRCLLWFRKIEENIFWQMSQPKDAETSDERRAWEWTEWGNCEVKFLKVCSISPSVIEKLLV